MGKLEVIELLESIFRHAYDREMACRLPDNAVLAALELLEDEAISAKLAYYNGEKY